MINAGIFGGSGYMGGEVLRVLNEHPEVKVKWVTSRGNTSLEYIHKNFYGSGIEFIKPEEAGSCDVVFMALPSGIPMSIAREWRQKGAKVIDLGADFRLLKKETWEKVYNKQHTAWDLVQESVYGIPEFHREKIKKAAIIANPGCFASSGIFGLAPVIKEGLIDTKHIIIDGLSGTTGAGAEVDQALHHPEIGNNILPYNVVDHRHTYEIEQELNLLSKEEVVINFTAYYVPVTRGILATSHCFPNKKITRKDLLELYMEFYKNEPFIKILNIEKNKNSQWENLPYPWINVVSGTNYCHISLDVDEKRNRIVIFSVLDSIGKGGAQAGVQNMNLMFGLDETMGLKRLGYHPY